MKRKYDIVATIGKYTDKEGKEKNRYLSVGAVLERDDGTLCMKLDALPVVSEGWFNFFDPKPRDGAVATPTPSAAAKPAAKDFDDEIPF